MSSSPKTVPARAFWGLVVINSAVGTGAAFLQTQAISNNVAGFSELSLYLSVGRVLLPLMVLILAKFAASGWASPRVLLIGAGLVILAIMLGISFAPDMALYAMIVSYALVSVATFASILMLFRSGNARPWPVGGIMLAQVGAISHAIEPALRDIGLANPDSTGMEPILLASVAIQFVVGLALALPILRADLRWADSPRLLPAPATLTLLGSALLVGAAGVAMQMLLPEIAQQVSRMSLALAYSLSPYGILIMVVALSRVPFPPLLGAAILLVAVALLMLMASASISVLTIMAVVLCLAAARYCLIMGFLDSAEGAWAIGLYMCMAPIGGMLFWFVPELMMPGVGVGIIALLCVIAALLAWRVGSSNAA